MNRFRVGPAPFNPGARDADDGRRRTAAVFCYPIRDFSPANRTSRTCGARLHRIRPWPALAVGVAEILRLLYSTPAVLHTQALTAQARRPRAAAQDSVVSANPHQATAGEHPVGDVDTVRRDHYAARL